MKTFTFNYNGCTGNGRMTIDAHNKKEAIELAKEKYPFLGVCVSSFRVKK